MHLFNLENWKGFSNLVSILVDDSENLEGQSVCGEGCALGSVFNLHVKDPFVDLDPGQARLLHNSLPLLAVQLAASFGVDAAQVVDLVVVLADSILLISTSARSPVLALTLARDQGELLRLFSIVRVMFGLSEIVIQGDRIVKVRHLPHFTAIILLPVRF